MARSKGGQPGNKNALKHGWYSSAFTPSEDQAYSDLEASTLKDEVHMLRVAIRRVFAYMQTEKDPANLTNALSVLSRASTAMSSLVRTMDSLKNAGDLAEWHKAVRQAIDITSQDWK